MSTLNTTRNRLPVLVALLATFAASAHAAESAGPVVDTQTKVAAVLAGTPPSVGARAEVNIREVNGADAASHAADVQEITQRLLLGVNGSNGNRSSHVNNQPSVGSNGHSGEDAQKLAQAVVAGQIARANAPTTLALR